MAMVGSDHDLVYPMPTLVEIEPGRWRVFRRPPPDRRSELGFPMVISDEMPPTEQVDGQYYTSKARFRAVGRALGLVEVGTEKVGPKPRASASRENKAARMASLQKAVEQYRSGRRPRRAVSEP
jgi:hypothetical protein